MFNQSEFFIFQFHLKELVEKQKKLKTRLFKLTTVVKIYHTECIFFYLSKRKFK